MKRRDIEREVGKFVLDAAALVATHPGGVWQGEFPGGVYGEDCRCIGVMVFLDATGRPERPGLVLETLDGNRLYTCTHARVQVREAVQ